MLILFTEIFTETFIKLIVIHTIILYCIISYPHCIQKIIGLTRQYTNEELMRRAGIKFANDTKLVDTVSSECEINQLRSGLKQLYDWSVDWQMLFNADKCKVSHFGYKNISNIYSLGDEVINAENEGKDLGVIVSDTLKPRSQCIAAPQ